MFRQISRFRCTGRFQLLFLAAITLGFFAGPVLASQTYPVKPIKIVVPWTPGGNVDSVTRLIANHLAAKMKQPVIVENKGGANGIIGTEYAARSSPDGYTLVIANAETHSINPSVYQQLSYDPIKDFSPILGIGKMAFVLAARPGLPANTLEEVVALAKRDPGELTFGSWGIGSVPHLAMEFLMEQTQTSLLHVPYKGGPEVYSALMSSQIDLATFPPYMAKPLAASGKLKLISLFDSTREPDIPAVPTITESGYNVEVNSVLGLLAPAGTPPAV